MSTESCNFQFLPILLRFFFNLKLNFVELATGSGLAKKTKHNHMSTFHLRKSVNLAPNCAYSGFKDFQYSAIEFSQISFKII